MALQSEQQQQQTLNGPVAKVDEITLPCQLVGDDDSQTWGFSIPDLPEDIWRHIHSLMPMDAAARPACLSHAFLTSWRCYPKLDLNPGTLCCETDRTNLRCRVDSILRNHSGIGLKILELYLWHEKGCFPYIDSWLQFAVTPGIEEITLCLYEEYNFPCSLLSDGVRNSVRSLHLINCTFRPMPEVGTLRSLTRLRLWSVRITGDELERLLSNSLALEHLRLNDCKEIIILKIPSVLQQLSYLESLGCVSFHGNLVPECKALSILSCKLRYVVTHLGASIDSISWSPLQVCQDRAEYESVFGASLHLRQLPEHLKLKSVEIVEFKSAKILVELTCCIVKSAASLERLTLNTFDDFSRCSGENNSDCRDEMCRPIRKAVLEEASRAVVAIRRYIEDIVPATAKLTVLEP